MLEKQTQLAKKMILSITRSSQSNTDHDLIEITQGILYDALQVCYGLAPDWNLFVHGGQFESVDETVKAQIASFQTSEGQTKSTLWALRIRIRDSASKRRTWVVQIGLREIDADLIKLYYALGYNDHMAGSFSLPKPLMISISEPIDVFFTASQVRCLCGAYPWPAAAIELRHALLPDFLGQLQDDKRSVPIVLISCPDVVNPDVLYHMAKGNFLVYWCADAGVVSRMNDHLPEQFRTPWDSVRVFLPFGEAQQFHPLFTFSDIERISADTLFASLYQAYCQYLRAEDRREFVTLQDIAKLRDANILSTLRARLDVSEENERKLSDKLSKTSIEYENLQKQWTTLSEKHKQSAAAEYEELLSEAIDEADALKTGIARLTARLYTGFSQ